MVAMHRSDPAALEKVRNELTCQMFENAPEDVRRRLEGLQFRINMELRRARTPEARFIKISSMMHESFAELNHCLNNPHAALEKKDTRPATVVRLDDHPRPH